MTKRPAAELTPAPAAGEPSGRVQAPEIASAAPAIRGMTSSEIGLQSAGDLNDVDGPSSARVRH